MTLPGVYRGEIFTCDGYIDTTSSGPGGTSDGYLS